MIRAKRPEADLKRSYRKVLSTSMVLSALLHLGILSLLPFPEFAPAVRRREAVVIELERIPQTHQQLPPPLLQPEEVAAAPLDTLPHYLLELESPDVITVFAPDDEEEVADFWMLEKRPRVLKRVLPRYPDSARQALLEGKVFVRILLDQQGRVLRLGQISGPPVFHQAASEAARQWEFTPAIQNDQAVRVWVSLPFTFQLEAPADSSRAK